MKVLLLGANGQVGFELQGALAPHFDVVCATRNGALADGTPCEQADLADVDMLPALLNRIGPNIVVNAAAYTAVDRAEDEPELARRINGEAVGALGRWAQRHGALVVHYSTDYVFDGQGTSPYAVNAPTAPLGAYGASKLAGETALRDSGADHLIFRTAWVYASHGANFLRTMLRLGRERDRLTVVDDQRGAPTPARLIAEGTATALTRLVSFSEAERASALGTHHLVSAGDCTWCEFARAIFARATAAKLIERAPEVAAITTAQFPTKARRPAYSVLDTRSLRDTFGIDLPSWQSGLDSVIGELAG